MGKRVVIHGFGNVGSWAGRIAQERGAKVIAIADVSGGYVDEAGIDLNSALTHVATHRSLAGFSAKRTCPGNEVLLVPCDILIPAALGGVITSDVAKEIRTSVIVEGANAPTTPDADRILQQRDIVVLPDIYANAGGVTVSYFEWVQNLQSFYWDEVKVNEELARVMKRSFRDLADTARAHGVDFRTAAFVLAIGRVAHATKLRGL